MIYRSKKKMPRENYNHQSGIPRSSKSTTTWVQCLFGVVYCFLWYFSILAGFFMLLCPAIPLAFIDANAFRKWGDLVFGMWEPYPVALMEIFFNVRVILSGDLIDPSENAIFIMNHRTRLDWNFLWAAVYHAAHPHCHNLKFILKAPIMHIPGPGWVMQTCSFLFIHRCWEKDRLLLMNSLDLLKCTKRPFQILIFPEGTNLTSNSLERSHKFADANHLERFYQVLHPKTTGFAFLVSQMKNNLSSFAVYDLTVGYPKALPETELDLLRGKMPEELHVDIKRYSSEEIPDGENSIKTWLSRVWKNKELKLRRFYANASFVHQDKTPDCSEQNAHNENITNNLNGDIKLPNSIPDRLVLGRNLLSNYQPGNMLYMALLFWTNIVFIFFYLIIFNFNFQIWVGIYTAFFIFVSLATSGFHQMMAVYVSWRNNGTANLIKKYE